MRKILINVDVDTIDEIFISELKDILTLKPGKHPDDKMIKEEVDAAVRVILRYYGH